MMTIDRPGIYTISAADYHRDPCIEPSLSSSIAKKICLESARHAQHDHPRLNPDAAHENGEHFDIGTAAHALLLEGAGPIAIIDAPDWRTKAAKEARDVAYAAGLTPLLAGRWADVQALVAAARVQLAQHTDGGAEMFLDGQPEQTLVWLEGDVWCRARVDWLRPGAIDDFKTAESAEPDRWARQMFAYGFDLQAAWYLRGLKALTGIDGVFRFAVIEREPPHVLSVVGLSPSSMTIGEKKVLYALDVWQRCLKAGQWPGYPTRTCWIDLPAWEEARWLEKEMR
jgi:hypothetical protein